MNSNTGNLVRNRPVVNELFDNGDTLLQMGMDGLEGLFDAMARCSSTQGAVMTILGWASNWKSTEFFLQ